MKYVLALMLCMISQTCLAANQGYFECFHLNADQILWFGRQPVSGCCALGDGMPVRYEQRADGFYVPPYNQALFEAQQCRAGNAWQENEDHSGEDRTAWIKVPVETVLKTKNMIGVGIVWWGSGNAMEGGAYQMLVKCAIFGVLT